MRPQARIVVTNVSPSAVTLTIDGQWSRELAVGDSIEVKKAERPLRTFRPRSTFFAILRQKLAWGDARAADSKGRRACTACLELVAAYSGFAC